VLHRDTAAVRRLTAMDAPYACVHPGASRSDRRWSLVNFARVADQLVQRGLRIFITGSAAEKELAQTVVSGMKESADIVAGCTDLGALAALLRGAQIVVSNDTGVGHLAAAVDAPAVVIFTTSDAERWAPQPARRRRSVVGSESPAVDEVVRALDDVMSHA
jgi:ADP-heptose:LPS heptosyltransferase